VPAVRKGCPGTGPLAGANLRYVWRPRPEGGAQGAQEYIRAACAAKELEYEVRRS